MKKPDLSQTVSILANVGVIAGIIFLAIELRQNNELLETEIDQQFFENRLTYRSDVIRDPALAEVVRKVRAGEPLTEVESVRHELMLERLFLNFEWEYSQFEKGRIDELPFLQWRGATESSDTARRIWDQMAVRYAETYPTFLQFMDENVVDEQ